mmetsp:Transcript_13934/g.30741  ORF Transcript_13934/g.30741 Transcript_13934/m.30741 type:complete len:327 (-) Transcript_13934:299-1279(-)
MTAHWGVHPEYLHLMSKNFSMPMSAPNPASVTQKPSGPTTFRAIWSAMMDELPWAMLAKGPACTNTGVCSTVCMAVGAIASFIKTARAPATPRSSAVTGCLVFDMPMTMLPSLSRISDREVVRASTAMTSEATLMSKPVSLGKFSCLPTPLVMPLKKRSHTSSTLFHVMVSGSMSRRAKAVFSSSVSSLGSVLTMPSFSRRFSITGANLRTPALSTGHRRENIDLSDWLASWYMRVSIAAETRLLAAVTAWMSPVRCRLNSSIGITCAYPPPAAPPLIPKVGPCEGWRIQATVFLPRWAPRACARPMVVVDLPSPRGVGLMPVTTT